MRPAFAAALLLVCAPAALANSTSARVALRWKAVEGASGYDLEIARDPAFKEIVLRQRTRAPGFRWDELPRVPYFWRVRSLDAESRAGDWSEVERIEPAVAAPEPASPRNNAVVSSGGAFELDLAAHASPLLREYIFELSADPAFARGVQVRRSTSAAARFPLDGPGTFHWRVRGVDLSGRDAGTSPTWRVEVRLGPPEPEAPPHLAQFPWRGGSPPVVLKWKPHPHARTYAVELSEGGGAPRVVTVERNELEVPAAAPAQVSWRVAAVDAAGRKTPFSAARAYTFVVPSPQAVAPAPGARVRALRGQGPVRFAWKLPQAARGAEIQIARDAAFAQPVHRLRVEGTQLEANLPGPGTYYWRATGTGAAGVAFATSEPAAFELAEARPPKAPALTAPLADAVFAPAPGAEVRVAWAEVQGATRYEVSVDGAAGSQAIQVARPEHVLAGLAEGEHQVRVRAVDELELASEWSAPVPFHVGVPEAVRAELDVGEEALPADGVASRALRFRLYDAKGRPVRGAQPVVVASAGTVHEVVPEGDGFRAEYVAPRMAPEGGAAEIRLSERAFQASARLPLAERPRRIELSVRAGWGTAFNLVSSPFLGLELGWEPGWLQRRLVLSARVGLRGGGGRLEMEPEFTAQTRVVPILAVAWWRVPAGPLDVRAGAGAGLHLVRSWIVEDAQSEVAVAPAGALMLGASRPLGPGRLLLELSWEFVSIEGELAHGRTGGLLGTVGYGVDL